MVFHSLVMILPRFFRLWKTITKSLDKNEKSKANFVDRNIMNKCARFHGDSPKGKKIKFNLPSAIELSETAVFVYNPMQASNFGGTFDRLFLWIFLWIFIEDASLPLLYRCAKSQKWPKTQIKGVLP